MPRGSDFRPDPPDRFRDPFGLLRHPVVHVGVGDGRLQAAGHRFAPGAEDRGSVFDDVELCSAVSPLFLGYIADRFSRMGMLIGSLVVRRRGVLLHPVRPPGGRPLDPGGVRRVGVGGDGPDHRLPGGPAANARRPGLRGSAIGFFMLDRHHQRGGDQLYFRDSVRQARLYRPVPVPGPAEPAVRRHRPGPAESKVRVRSRSKHPIDVQFHRLRPALANADEGVFHQPAVRPRLDVGVPGQVRKS